MLFTLLECLNVCVTDVDINPLGLASELQLASCLHLPGTGILGMHCHAKL